MNIPNLSGLITLVLLVAFVVGWIWAWSSKRKAAFDAAARLPLDEDAPDSPPAAAPSHEKTP
jgi:cytochrome c oxidase cbb3-type subunit 4